MAEGLYYCVYTKTIHKGFFLATLEKLTRDCPGGSYIVLNISPRVHGNRPLMAIGYKYNFRNVLGFIATEGAGSNEPAGHYLYFSLTFNLMFLFAPFFVLTWYSGI